MLYSAGAIHRTVSPISPITYSPFGQSAYRESAGSWLKSSYSNPYEQYAKSAATRIANFLNSAQNVQSSANSLIQKSTSSLQARQVHSSDEMAVVATAQNGAALNAYKVKVDSLAHSQKNSGLDLSSQTLTAIQSGSNEIKLTLGGKSTIIRSNIATMDTNEQALTKLKNAINSSHTGVTANRVTNSESGTSKLELTSDKTGTKQAFEITDEVGNAAVRTGINRTTTAATDSSYTVNDGKAQTSQSNEIELEKGKVNATLLKPTTETIDIKVRPDEKKAVQQVKELISSYNSMLERINEAGGYLNPAVRRSLEQVVTSSSYESLGIRKISDGTLKLDEAKFNQSLSTNYEQTSKAISGSNSLAKSIERASGRFNEVPASSMLNQKMQAMQQFTTYQSSMQYHLPFPISGLLLNSVF